MNLLSLGPAVLAEVNQTALDALRQGFRSQPHDSDPVRLLSAAVGLVALVMLLDRIARLCSGRGQVKRVDYLGLMGRRLGLLGHEMHMLRKLAKRSRLAHPARMLLSPANLAYAAHAAQGGKPDPRILLRINGLSLKLFGTPLPSPPDAG